MIRILPQIHKQIIHLIILKKRKLNIINNLLILEIKISSLMIIMNKIYKILIFNNKINKTNKEIIKVYLNNKNQTNKQIKLIYFKIQL